MAVLELCLGLYQLRCRTFASFATLAVKSSFVGVKDFAAIYEDAKSAKKRKAGESLRDASVRSAWRGIA